MSTSFDFEAPDHFTTGTVGPSGQRIFYLQAREARRIVTLKVEKEQVRALAEYLAGFLARLKGKAEAAPDDLALLEPVEAAWDVGLHRRGLRRGHATASSSRRPRPSRRKRAARSRRPRAFASRAGRRRASWSERRS